MIPANVPSSPNPAPRKNAVWQLWDKIPLYGRIVLAVIIGLIVGLAFGQRAAFLETPAKLILRILGALAPPLILTAIVQALMKTEIRGKQAGRLAFLLITNTLVAIVFGLLVANVIQPGRFAKLDAPPEKVKLSVGETDPNRKAVLETLEKYRFEPSKTGERPDPVAAFIDNVPKTLIGPLVENNIIGVIFVAIAFGVALRGVKNKPVQTVGDLVDLSFETLLTILHWVIALVPLGVFGIVASIVGAKGLAPFASLGVFIVTVLCGLALQTAFYLVRIRFGSWAKPMDVLRGVSPAIAVAFSTDSSTAAMPVNYECLREKVGLREKAASLGALVGTNFNNDGTALYEAVSALFIAQLIGRDLSLWDQLLVVVTSVAASVGAAGIPEAGLVTMTLVFGAVGLPVRYIALLLTVDWFLDRCRTCVNILGDVNVSCLLDGKEAPTPEEIAADDLRGVVR